MGKRTVLAAALGLLLSVSAAHAVPVFADDFNANVAGRNVTPQGWTLRYGSVDVLGPGFFTGVYPGNGGKVDLEGSDRVAGGIETARTFNLLKDHIYTLKFDYGKVSTAADAMNFGVGSFTGSLAMGAVTLPGYVQNTFSFLVTSNMLGVKIFFDGAPSTNGTGFIIDNVALSTVSTIPVPPALLLLASGLIGLGTLTRKRKAKFA